MTNTAMFDVKPTTVIHVSLNGSDIGSHAAGQAYRTIQAAVNAAKPGTAIMVHAGVYVENVKLPSTGGSASAPIWLVSADGPQTATIVAKDSSLPVIKALGTDNVVIDGFELKGGQNGIQFSQSGNNFKNMVDNVLIRNNVISDTSEDGIKISQATNVTIFNNLVRNTGKEAIDLVATSDAVIAHNELYDTRSTSAAVFAKAGSDHILIDSNVIKGSASDGIVVGGWSSFDYDANGLLLYWRPGASGYEVKDVTVTNNIVTDVARRPVNVLGGVNVDIHHNYLQANPAYYTVIGVDKGSPLSPVPLYASNVAIHDNILSRATNQIAVGAGSSVAAFKNNTVASLAQAGSAFQGAGLLTELVVDASANRASSGGRITGTVRADNLYGTATADILDGGLGADKMAGGAGDDTYFVDNVGDVVLEAVNAGVDTVQSSLASYLLGANVESLVVTRTTGAVAAGNAASNAIVGGAGDDMLIGGRGDDTLTGGAGADTFIFKMADGDDVITDFQLNDRVALDGYGFQDFAAVKAAMTQAGANTVLNLGGGDSIVFQAATVASFKSGQFLLGSPANVSPIDTGARAALAGTSSEDLQIGTSSGNFFSSVSGDDIMIGGKGNDLYNVNSAGDRIVEFANEGTDEVNLFIADYRLADNVENLSVKINAAHVVGNAMGNIIRGGAGNDVIEGGLGRDQLWGGSGKDTFIYNAIEEGGDVIRDFQRGSDVLDLHNIMTSNPGATLSFQQTNSGLDVMMAAPGIATVTLATLQGVTASGLTAGVDYRL